MVETSNVSTDSTHCFFNSTKNWPRYCRDSAKGAVRDFWYCLVTYSLSCLGNGPFLNASFIHLDENFPYRKMQTEDNIEVKGLKPLLIHFFSSSCSCLFNPNRTGNLSLLLLWFVSSSRPHFLFLLTISKQDQEYLSAPCPNCLCQPQASSRSIGTIQTQDCYT